MTREEIEAVRKNNAQIVKDICAKHGFYGNVIYYEPSPVPGSSMNRMYAIAGLDPVFGKEHLPKNLSLDEMLEIIQRNEKLFYPRAFVLDLKEVSDENSATYLLDEYCKKAGIIADIYGEYGLPVPYKLRESEVYQLINSYYGLKNPNISLSMKQKYRKDLDWFFRREKTRNRFRRNWLNYFRSDKFPDDKGPVAKILGFFRREQCEVSLEQLLDNHKSVSKLEMQEYEFKIFQKLIQERYPFVSYAVGDKEIVDHGINRATQRDDSPFGKYVTAEEYAVIRKDRFADEGWDCVANLKPAYWEFREIYYKDCDKSVIASVYQHITLQYAKSNSLGDLKRNGPMKLQKILASDFMNFVSLAKANKLRFYIDTLGEYEKPDFNTYNILYNESQQQKMASVLTRMNDDKVNSSHVLHSPNRPSLNSQIHEIEGKNRVNLIRHPHKGRPFEK